MNEVQKALKLSAFLTQTDKHQEPVSKPPDSEEEQGLIDLAASLLAGPAFQLSAQQNRRLQSELNKLAQQANPQRARFVRRARTVSMVLKTAGVVLALSFTALLLSTFLRRTAQIPLPSSPQPLQQNSLTPSTPRPTQQNSPTPSATLTAEVIPASQALAADACLLDAKSVLLEQQLHYPGGFPQKFAGGGKIDSGEFTFDLWLACDEQFSNTAIGGDPFSEINGLGLLASWSYHGQKQEGTMTDFAGFEPFVFENSGSSPVGETMQSFMLRGIQFPASILPDFSQQDTFLRFIYFTELPDGIRNGVALTFQLKREESGYRPVDIQVSQLSPEELIAAEKQDVNSLPFAEKDLLTEYPLLAAVKGKVDPWQSALLSGGGWIVQRTQIEDQSGNTLMAGITHYQSEYWTFINELGLVTQSVYLAKSGDGSILQASVYSDGINRSLTYGTSSSQIDAYPLDYSQQLIDSLTPYLRSGQDIGPRLVDWQGQPAEMFTLRDAYSEPVSLNNISTSATETRQVVSVENGAPLGFETAVFTPQGQEILLYRYVQSFERVETPPAEVLSLLGQVPAAYQPPQAEGEKPPQGFDPSAEPLRLISYPGDDFTQPTYWLGDIFAGNYLLGRANFGSTPGGWCQRSADGARIAFVYSTISNEQASQNSVRWLELSDVDNVHEADIQLNLISLFAAWSPVKAEFAFTACDPQGQCGLYLLDAETSQTRLLSTAGTSGWPLLWKPDGSQIAMVDGSDEHRLYVLDSTSGAIVYQGIFDTQAWSMPPDSPPAQWGIPLPHGWDPDSDCFE
jgi:hypothetical protein